MPSPLRNRFSLPLHYSYLFEEEEEIHSSPSTHSLIRILQCDAALHLSLAGQSHSPVDLHLTIDIFDESGIRCGASGVAGGLLHPYSPKGRQLLEGVSEASKHSKSSN
ncbi:hypothetical protein SAY87_018874 [Trapa incisa]|uniref:Uncharacterized protein n=1 Tax=Trapa incisa TaxID=236973 RepID=A0AAN7JYB8_9MYRT|nr:hypothetical protein SAY87_018874 [Trapa incisa]